MFAVHVSLGWSKRRSDAAVLLYRGRCGSASRIHILCHRHCCSARPWWDDASAAASTGPRCGPLGSIAAYGTAGVGPGNTFSKYDSKYFRFVCISKCFKIIYGSDQKTLKIHLKRLRSDAGCPVRYTHRTFTHYTLGPALRIQGFWLCPHS